MNNKIKILVLAANPVNTSQLRLGEEVRSIKQILKQAKYRDHFELIDQGAVRVQDLSIPMLENKPQIVHFSGHGVGSQTSSQDDSTRKGIPDPEAVTEPEGLVLEDDQGRAKLVRTDALAGFFKLFKNDVKCVVLNACYSEMLAKAINQHIEYVIGMNKAIGDRAAINFATEFYQALMTGCSFKTAFELARNSLNLANIPESSTPVLLINEEGSDDPFKIKTSPPNSAPPVTVTAPQPKRRVKQSQSFGNITFSGNNNPFNAIQSTGNVNVTQTNTQTAGGNTNLQAALKALAKLKEQLAVTDGLSTFVKKDTESKIKMLEEELQKPQPDKSFVDEVVEVLKQGLTGVSTLASPVTQVATLVAKVWGELG